MSQRQTLDGRQEKDELACPLGEHVATATLVVMESNLWHLEGVGSENPTVQPGHTLLEKHLAPGVCALPPMGTAETGRLPTNHVILPPDPTASSISPPTPLDPPA